MRIRARAITASVIAAILTLISASAWLAENVPPLTPSSPMTQVNYSVSYSTYESAAAMALIGARRSTIAENVEYGGAVIRCGKRFYNTFPVTQHKYLTVNYEWPRMDRCSAAGLWHTHPHGTNPWFSSVDVNWAQEAGLPSMIWAVDEKAPRVYYPGYSLVYNDKELGPISDGEPLP